MKTIHFPTLVSCLCCLLGLFVQMTAQPLTPQIAFTDIRARAIGPAAMSGRVSDIDGVQAKPEIIYVGGANGGVWKSISGGVSFRPVFDEYPQSIGKITIDQQHPDTVWVGTGESWVRNSTSIGTGIYLTRNGGNTWEFKGLPNSERISDIIVAPNNSNVIYVAVQGHLWNSNEDRGVYKSTDFGTTWQKILYIDANTGCADLTIDPKNPDVLYAAMWEHRRLPDYFESGGKSSGLFKTSDGGKTWNKVSGNGFPTSNLGRIAVAIAPSNNNFIYLTVECEKKEEKGLYRSEDAGATWKKISSEFVITVRPFYFARLVVDPTNHKKLYKCSFIAGISEDGGESFRSIDGNVHADSHAFWISEKNPNTVFVGTDGGAYRSDDGGKVFEMCKDLPLSQFYHVAVDNETPFNVYGGLQDNGSWYAPSQAAGGIQNKHWEVTCYGDGFKSYPHPADNNIVYSESQEGNIVRFNKRDGQLKDIRPIEPSREEPKYRFNWNSPIYISPTNPERLYFACQYLFLSTNRGDSWTKISSDLTTNTPTRQRQKSSGGYTRENTGAEMNTTVYTIAENRLDANTIWVGTDDGNVQVTTNGGKNWADVTKNIQGLPQYTWCSHVEASRFDKNAAYAVFDGHRTGDKKPYIFKTTDLGKTWTSLASADIDAYAITIKEDSKSPNVLFLGTEFGMFISVDGGQGWKRFTNNLPKTSVQYLAIQERDDALAIATHGRGIYIIDDISPLRELTAEVLAKDFHFFNIKPGELNLERFSEPYGGSGMYRGENPDRTVKINYFMKKRHTFGKMGVEVYDESGKLVKELPAGKNAGINIVQLPLRLPMAKAAPTLNIQALGGGIFPPTLPEGKYTVKVKKGAEEYTTQVSLGYDKIAAAAYPLADRQLAHKTLMRLYEITNQLGYMYYAMKDMQEAAQKLGKDSTDRAFAKQCNTFADSVAAYKDGLVALEGDGYTDSGTNLREEISNLYGGVSRYPGKPSDGQVSKTTYYEGEIEKVKTKFNHFVAEMTKLNTTIAQLQKTPIKIKTFEEYMK